MAKPQLEDGYTRIANEVLEHLMRLHLSPNQWRVLLCIVRKTCGFHKKVDYIANSQIVEATGLCKAVVSRAVKGMESRHIITRRGKLLGIEEDWELWQKLAEPLTNKKLAIPSTKVSSCAVTQKIKDNVQKKKQKKEDITKSFNIFWGAYPRKVAKADAEKLFAQINSDEQLLKTMLATIEKASKSERWLKENGKYIPYPTTWLNGRRWEDEVVSTGLGLGKKLGDDKWPKHL